MEGVLGALSGLSALIGLCAIVCEVYQLGYMTVTNRKLGENAQETEVAIGGAVFIGLCATLWVLFGVLAIAAGA